jgi:hypothetical protein
MRTPSISNAKANESAVGISAGVRGEPGSSGVLDVGDTRASSSRFMLASSPLATSMEAAKLPAYDRERSIILSGTTTTRPPEFMSFGVAVIDERRRSPGLPFGGAKKFSVGAIVIDMDPFRWTIIRKGSQRIGAGLTRICRWLCLRAREIERRNGFKRDSAVRDVEFVSGTREVHVLYSPLVGKYERRTLGTLGG